MANVSVSASSAAREVGDYPTTEACSPMMSIAVITDLTLKLQLILPEIQAGISAVTGLPKTGSGSAATEAPRLWIAAMLSVVALGATAVGIRVNIRR